MKRTSAALLLALALALHGCASPPQPAERPYSNAQIKQSALEILSRSGLSPEDYAKVRNALTAPRHRMSNSIRDF